MVIIGEIAALFTSLCLSLAAIGFTKSSQQVGAQVTNRVRILVALIILIIINTAFYNQPIPLNAGVSRWIWLSISGIIGLSLGDAFLFAAFREIGPRLGLLLLSLAPIFGSAIAWIFFGQTLPFLQIIGIVITLVGISWVVWTNQKNGDEKVQKLTGRGIVFGILAALGQAIGLVLSQQGMTGSFSPFAGGLIRMLAAFAVLWIITIFQRQAGSTVSLMVKQPAALDWIIFGALLGPVIGVSSSLLAIQYTEIGVASTLMALPPIFMLPISHFVFKERLNWPTIAGTFVAIVGVAILFSK